MSNVGLGAFVQGLTQGYVVGDKLQTNAQEREVRGLQMGKLKRDIARDEEIDTARTNVIAASKNLIANPDDDSIRSRHRQALIDYTAVATPEKLPEVQKTFRNEDIENTSRTAAPIIRGLLSGDTNAISAAAKLNGFVPNGVEIDPSASGFNKDGSIRFALVKTDSGERLPERTVSREQILTMGLGFMSSPDKFFEMTAKMFDSSQDRATKERGQNLDYQAATARTGAIVQGNQINAGLRQDAQADRALQTDLGEIRNVFAPRIKAIQDNIDSKYDSKKQAELLTAEEARMSLVDSIVRINAERGIRVPVRQVAAQADALARGEGIVGVPKGMENSGYGLTRQGFLVPLPPNARVTPRQ